MDPVMKIKQQQNTSQLGCQQNDTDVLLFFPQKILQGWMFAVFGISSNRKGFSANGYLAEELIDRIWLCFGIKS